MTEHRLRNGDVVRIEYGVYHSINDKPAIVKPNGDAFWYYKGNLHRENGPALLKVNGNYVWYKHGIRHRDDGIAYHNQNSDRYYYEGRLHNTKGPAIISSVMKEWFSYGKRHREDGPAIEQKNGNNSWYWHDIKLRVNSLEEFQLAVKLISFM